VNRTTRFSYRTDVDADRVFLTAQWQHLAMLNYEVDDCLLLPFVPAGTELDRWSGRVFASLVGFRFLNTRILGFLPIPLHSSFDEVNLRFYVRRQVGQETRRGVVFIKEIVPRRAIAFVARTVYQENYLALPMAHDIHSAGDILRVSYRWKSEWKSKNIWNTISLETVGNGEIPGEGSAEQFITEHYWGYAAQPAGGCVEYRVAHPSWRVWQARESAFDGDAEGLYGEDLAAVLRRKPASAFLAEGSAVSVMRGQRL